jgi:hypothetical protein
VKLTSPHFISGVVKIQEKDFARMSVDEIQACKALKLPGERSNNDLLAGARGSRTFKEIMADRGRVALKKQKLDKTSDHGGYIDCRFILGSAAEVERCWSEARYVLPNQRAGMAPEFFEAIMMLRYNSQLWDKRLVAEAKDMVAKDNSDRRIAKRMEAVNEFMELETNDFNQQEVNN